MKIHITLLFMTVIYFSVFCQIPSVYTDYISDISKNTEYMEVFPSTNFVPVINKKEIPESLSYGQAVEDVVHFDYLLKNAYAGFDYFKKNGIDLDNRVKNLYKEYSLKSSKIDMLDFEKALSDIFEGVNDGHVAIRGNKEWRPFKRKNSYFTEILVEKYNNDVYIVINSAVDDVPIGSVYAGSEKNLFKTLSPTGKEHFLIGKMTENIEGFMDTDFIIKNTKWTVSVPLHSNWCGEYSEKDRKNSFFSNKNIKGVKLRDFTIFNKNYRDIKKTIILWAQSLIFEKNIFIDMFNAKGSEGIIEEFTQQINGTWEDPQYKAYLFSPATVQANSVSHNIKNEHFKSFLSKYTKDSETMRQSPERSFKMDFRLPRNRKDFSGKVIALSNRNTVSGAEDALMILKESFKDIIIAGENSAGVVRTGEVRYYQLPNSRLWIALPSAIYANDYNEGEGIMPDIWLDCPEPAAELAKWISDPDNYVYNFSCAIPESAKNIIDNNMSDLFKYIFSENVKDIIDVMDYIKDNGFDNERDIYSKGIATISSFSGKNAQRISIDTFVKKTGRGSLKFRNSDYTDVFDVYLWKIPQNNDVFNISYSVKGNNLKPSYYTSYGAFAAIVGQDKDGRIIFEKKEYNGTFDWKDDIISINLKEKSIDRAVFITGNFLSGIFYLDNIKINI